MNENTSFKVFISSIAFRLQTVCDLKNVDSCSLMSTHFLEHRRVDENTGFNRSEVKRR